MNKNLGLFTILISLIAIAFYFEEIKKPEKNSKIINEKRLISKTFKLSKIKLPKTTLTLKDKWEVVELDFDASSRTIALIAHSLKQRPLLR